MTDELKQSAGTNLHRMSPAQGIHTSSQEAHDRAHLELGERLRHLNALTNLIGIDLAGFLARDAERLFHADGREVTE